jgi:hypothetical protein
MRTIKQNDLVQIIREHSINVLGFIVTPWHLIGFRAFIEKLKAEGHYKNHLIIVCKNVQTGYVFNDSTLPEDAYVLENDEMPLLKASYIQKLSLFIKSQSDNADPLYIVSSWSFRIEIAILLYAKTERCCRLCKIDEGVATYMFTSNSLYLSLKHNDYNLLFRYIGSHFFKLFIRGSQNNNLLLTSGKKLVPNYSIIPYYKHVLNVGNSEVIYNDKDIVIATMAFQESEIYNNEMSLKINSLVDLLSSKGYHVIIKPHPRSLDIDSKYGCLQCEIVESSQSMEEFLMYYRPLAIISFSSTCLITSKIFYDIKAISVTNILDINNFGLVYKNELLTFKKIFKDVVLFPNSFQELSDLL